MYTLKVHFKYINFVPFYANFHLMYSLDMNLTRINPFKVKWVPTCGSHKKCTC